jgi:hypothetical protein
MAVVLVASLANIDGGLAAMALITRHSLETINQHYDTFARVKEGVVASRLVGCNLWGLNPASYRSLEFEKQVEPLVEELKQGIAIESATARKALKKVWEKMKKEHF